MSGTSNLLQLWQIPSTKLFLRSYKLPKELHASKYLRRIQTTTYEVVKASYITQKKPPETVKQVKNPPPAETIGAFQKLPMVKPSIDILCSALRKAKRVTATKGIANIAKRERNKGAKQLDALMKELGIPLREYAENFPKKEQLHPYERSLVELTLGDGNYEKVLKRVNALKIKVNSIGKEHASLCAKVEILSSNPRTILSL